MVDEINTLQLRTLSPKRWSLSFLGQKPTIDVNYTGVGKGCHVGDLVLDISQTPNYIWLCTIQTSGSSDFILLYPNKLITTTKTSDYTIDLDFDCLVPIDASTNDVTVILPVGTKIDGKSTYQLNVKNESISIYTPYKYGYKVSIKRIDNSSYHVFIISAGSDSANDWLII
jgi:hypothetical protein